MVSSGAISDAQASMMARPDVSEIVVDEDTGIKRIRQGKNVMDVVTRKAVKLSALGPHAGCGGEGWVQFREPRFEIVLRWGVV